MTRQSSPIFIVHLRAKPDSRSPIDRLKALLKDAGRRHGFACSDIREMTADDEADAQNRSPETGCAASEGIDPTDTSSATSTRENGSTAAGCVHVQRKGAQQ